MRIPAELWGSEVLSADFNGPFCIILADTGLLRLAQHEQIKPFEPQNLDKVVVGTDNNEVNLQRASVSYQVRIYESGPTLLPLLCSFTLH